MTQTNPLQADAVVEQRHRDRSAVHHGWTCYQNAALFASSGDMALVDNTAHLLAAFERDYLAIPQQGGADVLESIARAIDPSWWEWADRHFDAALGEDAKQKAFQLERARRVAALRPTPSADDLIERCAKVAETINQVGFCEVNMARNIATAIRKLKERGHEAFIQHDPMQSLSSQLLADLGTRRAQLARLYIMWEVLMAMPTEQNVAVEARDIKAARGWFEQIKPLVNDRELGMLAEHFARYRLRLQQPIGGTAREVWALVEPWKDFHGDLPDYDDPMRCVFESGVQYAVELLAKELGVEDYQPCDGTEEFDGDLGGTMMNIVCASLPEHSDGERMRPNEVAGVIAALSPVPIEAGEVLPAAYDGCTCLCHKQPGIVHMMACCGSGSAPAELKEWFERKVHLEDEPTPSASSEVHADTSGACARHGGTGYARGDQLQCPQCGADLESEGLAPDPLGLLKAGEDFATAVQELARRCGLTSMSVDFEGKRLNWARGRGCPDQVFVSAPSASSEVDREAVAKLVDTAILIHVDRSALFFERGDGLASNTGLLGADAILALLAPTGNSRGEG